MRFGDGYRLSYFAGYFREYASFLRHLHHSQHGRDPWLRAPCSSDAAEMNYDRRRPYVSKRMNDVLAIWNCDDGVGSTTRILESEIENDDDDETSQS